MGHFAICLLLNSKTEMFEWSCSLPQPDIKTLKFDSTEKGKKKLNTLLGPLVLKTFHIFVKKI